MAKPKEPRVTSEAIVTALVAELKPEVEITATEFLKRAFRSGAVEKVEVRRFSGGTWSFAEEVTDLSSSFNPEAVATYLTERYGRRRYRLGAVVDGSIIAWHLLNIDGWQAGEADEAARLPKGPILTPGSRPVGPGSTNEVVQVLRDRLEVENAVAALGASNAHRETSTVERDLAPMKMVMETMGTMMKTMADMVAAQRTVQPAVGNDAFTQFLLQQVNMLTTKLDQPPRERDTGAILKTFDTINTLLEKTLNSSIAEMLGAAKAGEPQHWLAGVMEGLRPYMDDIVGFMKARSAKPATPRWGGNVVPLPGITPPGALPASTTPTKEEATVATPQAMAPEMKDVLDQLITALESKNFRIVDAFLLNPPLHGTINLDPSVPASVYVTMLRTVDPRFKDLGPQIAEYLNHMQTAEAEEGGDDA